MSFLVRACIELSLLSVLSGVVGCWIVLRNRSFFATALSHATFPGGILAAVFGLNVLLGQAVAAFLLVLLMNLLSRVKQGAQVASGVVLVLGFSLGALFSSLQLGTRLPVESLLVGQLFAVQEFDIVVTAVAALFCCVLAAIFYRPLLFDTFDAEGCAAAGHSRVRTDLMSTALIAITVIVSLPAVGAILSIALVVGPAATARLIAPNIRWMVPLTIFFALTANALGLWASIAFGTASGGAIGVAIALQFLLVLGFRALLRLRTPVAQPPTL